MEYTAEKVACALAFVARERPVKTVCRTMGLTRSRARDLLGRDGGWTDGRSHTTPSEDEQLPAELLQEIAQLPSYGCEMYAGLQMLYMHFFIMELNNALAMARKLHQLTH